MADETVGICLPGSTEPDIVFSDGEPWNLTVFNCPGGEAKSYMVGDSDADGEMPARASKFGNVQGEIRIEMGPQTDIDTAFDAIGQLEQALREAERVAASGDWVDPGLDLVRLYWQAADSERELWRPIVGGSLQVPKVVQGEDAGYFLAAPVVPLSLTLGPAWYGPRGELVATTDTDAHRIADNSAIALDVPAVGGDLPPWVDLLVTEDDSQARHHVLITAESPKTGDADYIAATALTTTGYGGSVASGTMSMTSSDWRFMCEIPAQSHERPRKLTLVHASGGGQVRVRWKAGGTERESNVIQLPASGYADVEVVLVQGDWEGVIEGLGTVSFRGVRFDGADSRAEIWSPPATGLGTQGELTHNDSLFGTGSLNGQSLTLGGTWGTSGATTDYAKSASPNGATRSTSSDSSARIALAGSATPSWVYASVDVGCDTDWPFQWPSAAGLIVRYTNTSNFLFAGFSYSSSSVGPRFRVVLVIGGTATVLSEAAPGATAISNGNTVMLGVSEAGDWIAQCWQMNNWSSGVPGEHLQHAASGSLLSLATGGTLASGRVGLYDRQSYGSGSPTRRYRNFQVWDTPWRSAPLIPVAGDLRLAGATMLHDSGGDVPYRGNGLVNLHSQEVSRLYISAKRGRESVASVATNETDNLEVSVHARPRYLSVPTPAPADE